MKRSFRCAFAMFLTIIILGLALHCAAIEKIPDSSYEEIKKSIEDYLRRYNTVAHSLEDCKICEGTIKDLDKKELSDLNVFRNNVLSVEQIKYNAEFMQLKADYFRNFRKINMLFRENSTYEYIYHDIDINDQVATVSVSEYAFFNYIGDPQDSAFESVYSFVLLNHDGDWLVVEVKENNWFDSTFYNQALCDIEQETIELTKEALPEPDPTVDPLIIPNQADFANASASANYSIYYDQSNAAGYAMTYTTSGNTNQASFYNSNFKDWSSYGGDCQNFASQCVWAGFSGSNDTSSISEKIIPMDDVGSDGCKWFGAIPGGEEDGTSSWRGCDSFYNYINSSTQNTDVGISGDIYYINYGSGVTGLTASQLVGSVIQVDGYLNGEAAPYNHSVVVDSASGLSRNQIYCCAHSGMAKHMLLSDIAAYCQARIIVPNYFRTSYDPGNMLKGKLIAPVSQNTTTPIRVYANNTQYKMTMQVFSPSGTYATTTNYNCSSLAYPYTFAETGLYRIVAYAKPYSEDDVATSFQFYIRVY